MPMNPPNIRLATMAPLQTVPLISDALEYHHGTALPFFLKRRHDYAELIVPREFVIATGDTLLDEYDLEVVVTQIDERRPARGDWSDNPFDTAPDWLKVKIL